MDARSATPISVDPQVQGPQLRTFLKTMGEIALAGEVPLDTLLQRIVDSAQVLLNARYAALGIFDAEGRVTEFFTAGISADERHQIGALPVGAGLLGLIVREKRILRTPSIADHPASYGFPPNHPGMTSFLGGPIIRGGIIYGNLYLTDRQGAAEFTAEDEGLLALLAEQAAIVIENAKRFAQVSESERMIQALFEASRTLASSNDPDVVMQTLTQEACRLLGANISGLCFPEDSGRNLRWRLIHGGSSSPKREIIIPVEVSFAGRVIQTGAPFESDDLATLDGVARTNPLLAEASVRAVVIVPLGTNRPARGALMVGWQRPGSPPPEAVDVLERLADRAAIALDQAELHAREQAALRQSQIERSSLEAIFDSMTDAVFTTDLAGRIVRLNRRANAWINQRGQDVIGKCADEVFVLVDDLGTPVRLQADVVYASTEVSLLRSNGERIPVERVVSPIRDLSGRTLGTVQVLRDLRPQREVEQLKANIVSLVSHELRTPLSHIKGYASTLLQSDVEWDAETQRDFIASIDRQADRLARLISDLLEISRLDAGGTSRMERIPVRAETLLERGIRQAEPNAIDHPINTSVPEDLPLVMADVNHVERVLSNLIENAAKYSPAGTPIEVALATHPTGVIFSVQDHGSGLTADEHRHLFERFYRSPRVKHRTPGTGLGLAICKEIIQAHGGKIWAESVEGEGSTFHFTLPRVKVELK